MDSLFDITNNKFYSENPVGNTEYKWRLDTKNNIGQKKLLTQMMWRINEEFENTGEKFANYLLGIYDNGDLGGLSVVTTKNSINISDESLDSPVRFERLKYSSLISIPRK